MPEPTAKGQWEGDRGAQHHNLSQKTREVSCVLTHRHTSWLAKMVLKVAGLSRYRALENTAKCPFYIAHGTRCDTNAECNMAFRQGFGGLFGNQRDSQVTNIQNCFSKY